MEGSVLELTLKELGVRCRNFLNFVCKGLKFKTDFHSKMSVYRHELGVQPPVIPTLEGYCPSTLAVAFLVVFLMIIGNFF